MYKAEQEVQQDSFKFNVQASEKKINLQIQRKDFTQEHNTNK